PQAVPEKNDDDIFSKILRVNQRFQRHMEQGDIAIPTGKSSTSCSNGVCFWPKSADGLVRIPFTLDSKFTNKEKAIIWGAMHEYEMLTCVQFQNRTTEVNYVRFRSADGCWSYVGKTGGSQELSLMKAGCVKRGIVQHEINHILGFEHEQNRIDRAQYVKILWQNIDPAHYSSFKEHRTSNLGTRYDYSSIMHYGKYSFSRNGLKTLIPIPDENTIIGQRYGLSSMDIAKINKLYGCNVCSDLFPEHSGNLQSRDYPSPHQSYDCMFLIRTPEEKVFLEFDSFDLQTSLGCSGCYVKVYDGDVKSAPVLLDRTCGKTLPPVLIASRNLMLIEFASSSCPTTPGFAATYHTGSC
uniref:Metalloendopeptidase n=1 Tax=Latimeria chalumnae TaxID=7897 RepID=H3BFU2_LATCH